MTTGPALTLSHLSFDLLWSALDLGPFPLVLRLVSHGETIPEREVLLADDRPQLVGRGVLSRSGQVHPDVARVLETLARPDVEVDARSRTRQGRLRVLCAARGQSTVFAVRTDESVTLTPVTRGSHALAVVTAIPAHRPAPHAQVSGRSSEVGAALELVRGTGDAAVQAFVALGAPLDQARSLAESLRSVFAMTQIGAAARDEHGHRQRHPHVVAVFDGQLGRLVTTQRLAPDRTPWTTIRQATTEDLRAAVEGMLAPRATGVLR